jgi:hypothetical protein
MLIRLSYFSFYLTNLVNQDWFYLIDSQIMVNRDGISIIVASEKKICPVSPLSMGDFTIYYP